VATASKKLKKWSAGDIYALLERAFPAPAYALLNQVRNGTGYDRRVTRYADALAISCWPSRGLYLAGIEIKVSRGDWLKELALPDKSAEIQQYCKYWYLAVPTGLVLPGEVPETWGLIECGKTCRTTKAAPKLQPVAPDMPLVASIMRNVADSTVPRRQVTSQISKAIDELNERHRSDRHHRFEELKQSVSTFEKASGIQIADEWNLGDVGEAVKLLTELPESRCITRELEVIRDRHKVLAERLSAMLEENRGEEP